MTHYLQCSYLLDFMNTITNAISKMTATTTASIRDQTGTVAVSTVSWEVGAIVCSTKYKERLYV